MTFINEGHASIPWEVIDKQRLSFNAMGILTYMARYSSDVPFTRDMILKKTDSKEHYYKAGVQELKKKGLLIKLRERAESGKFGKWHTCVFASQSLRDEWLQRRGWKLNKDMHVLGVSPTGGIPTVGIPPFKYISTSNRKERKSWNGKKRVSTI
jgi:hypothetical protein